ncbi:MAG: cohesin domain-containing protein [Bacteroidetes bacterium]|nr:cohesin domain-containing protein [Bacteroidota bacterium]
MKKIFFTISFLWMVVAIQQVQAQTVQMRIPDSTALSGNFIDLPVYADNTLTGQNIFSYTLQITFNQNYLQLISVFTTGTISNAFGNPIINTTVPGQVTMAGAGTTPLTGIGKFICIRFKALQPAWIAVSFSGVQNNFFNEGIPAMDLDNGWLTINTPPSVAINPNSGSVTKGETMQFTVSGGLAPYQWSVTNAAVSSVSSSGLMTATQAGFTKVIVTDNQGLRDTTNSFIEIRPMRLSIPTNLSQIQGQYINIPVNATDLSGLGIYSGGFSFSYNQNLLIPMGIVQTGTLLSTYPVPVYNATVPGTFTINFAGTTALSGSGVLIYVKFQVSTTSTGTSALTFISGLFNEDMVPNFTNGQFTTVSLPSLSITPASGTLVAGQTKQFTLNGVGTPPIIWSVSNSGVANISSTGLMTTTHGGNVTVTAADFFGATATSGNWLVYDTRVWMPDTATCPAAGEFYYPITIEALPSEEDVSSIQATVTYNSTYLTFAELVSNGTLTQGWSYVANPAAGQVIFAGSGVNSFSAAGVLVKLRFTLKPAFVVGSNANLQLPSLLLNEGFPNPQIDVNGSITGINPSTSSVTIVAQPSVFVCVGATVTFSATPVNGGVPAYQWRKNDLVVNGATNAVFTTNVLQSNDVVTCVLTPGGSCVSVNPVISNALTMTVEPILPLGVSISASSNNVCQGEQVQYIATPLNGGSNPLFQWYVNNQLMSTGSGNTTNLLSYYPFTGNANDVSGNSNNGIVNGPVLTEDHNGSPDKAYYFNGNGNYIRIPQVNWPVLGSGDFTITAWVHPLSLNNYPMILVDNVSLDNFQLNFQNGGGYIQMYLGGGLAGMSNYYPFVAHTWYHIAVARANGTLMFFINGQEWGTVASSQYIQQSSFIDIGYRTINSSHPFNGSIDEVRVYNRSLSATEILGLYSNDGSGIFSYAPSNNDVVKCVMTSNASCVTGNPATSNTIVMVVNVLPVNTNVNGTIVNAQNQCYNATNSITVAGGGTSFLIQDGGSATLIAGQRIACLPNTFVQPGGYMHGFISPSGPFCQTPSMPAVFKEDEQAPAEIDSKQLSCKLYPNPTSGIIYLEFSSGSSSPLLVRIYNLMGAEVMNKSLVMTGKTTFSLENLAACIYLVSVKHEGKMEMFKIIKQ